MCGDRSVETRVRGRVVVVGATPTQLPAYAAGRQVLIWNGSGDGTVLQTLGDHLGAIYTLSWSQDGSQLVSAGDDRSVKVWAATARDDGGVDVALAWSSFGHRARVWGCRFVPSGPVAVASTSQDGTVVLWSRDGTQLSVLTGHCGKNVRCVAASPCCQVGAVGQAGGGVLCLGTSAPQGCRPCAVAGRVLRPVPLPADRCQQR